MANAVKLLLRDRAALFQLNKCSQAFSNAPLRKASSYDGEGKTTVTILNNSADSNLMINGYSQLGFRLNNDVMVLGSIAIFPRSILSWNVADFKDINDDSLSVFDILEPKLDLLIVGTGDKNHDVELHKRVMQYGKKLKINVEILPTEYAVSTFNFLSSEGRYVAAVMIPPSSVKTN